MPSIAVKNLFHDKVRLVVTLTGIIFSVVLVCIQVGLFLGFVQAIADVIDHSNADLWVMSHDVRYIEVGVNFPEKKLYDILATPGVAEAQKSIVQFSDWTRPDGAGENAELIGFNPESTLGGPWNIVEGSVGDLKRPDAVMVDKFYAERLGVTRLNQVCEIHQHRARVVGFTNGIRTFTTAATVFTSFKNAQTFDAIPENQTLFILVKAKPGTDLQELKRSIMSRVKDVDAWTTKEFSSKTVNYWMFSTGAGISVLIAAVLGLIVGVVVVAQTIYSATIDHIREFGTLKAMGASNFYIYRIILQQAAISAVIGYIAGISIALVSIHFAGDDAPIVLPAPVAAGMFFVTLAMCCVAALVSVNKVTHIDPAMVFKA